MSTQAGVWNLDGRPADRDLLKELSSAIAPYGPDGETIYIDGPFGMVYRPFHTTADSHSERQPYVTDRGLVMTWDGRLDNRADLLSELGGELRSLHTDLHIVVAAHERWGADFWRRLNGDWAMSIWDSRQMTLTLGRDYIGVRHFPTLHCAMHSGESSRPQQQIESKESN